METRFRRVENAIASRSGLRIKLLPTDMVINYIYHLNDRKLQYQAIGNIVASKCPKKISDLHKEGFVLPYLSDLPAKEKLSAILDIVASRSSPAINSLFQYGYLTWLLTQPMDKDKKLDTARKFLLSGCGDAIKLLVTTKWIDWFANPELPASELKERIRTIIVSRQSEVITHLMTIPYKNKKMLVWYLADPTKDFLFSFLRSCRPSHWLLDILKEAIAENNIIYTLLKNIDKRRFAKDRRDSFVRLLAKLSEMECDPIKHSEMDLDADEMEYDTTLSSEMDLDNDKSDRLSFESSGDFSPSSFGSSSPTFFSVKHRMETRKSLVEDLFKKSAMDEDNEDKKFEFR